MQSLKTYFGNYGTLSPESEAAIFNICSNLILLKGEELQPIGHTCRTIYYLKKGMARIYYYHDGIGVTESFAFENSIIARIESLFTGKPSRKAIQIIEDAEIVAIDATELFRLYDVYPEIERLFRKIFEAAFVETMNRMESIQFYTAEERYHELLERAPDLIRRIPLKYISSYLGITQQSLSRIRSAR